MGLTDLSAFLFETRKGKQAMGFAYGFGASIVIIGALFKIQHYPGATIMLIVGMGTEAIVFALSAFEPQHLELDWTLAYPELAGVDDDEEGETQSKSKGSVTEELDSMLEDAKIGPELIESLGTGLRSLSDNANKLSQISDASVATNEYSQSLVDATNKVHQLSESYTQASESLTGLKETQGEGEAAGHQLQEMTKNISALNSIYEQQIQSANENMKGTTEAYAGISDLLTNLKDSVDDTRQYKENIAELSHNLGALNRVYGNMLSAMNVNVGGKSE